MIFIDDDGKAITLSLEIDTTVQGSTKHVATPARIQTLLLGGMLFGFEPSMLWGALNGGLLNCDRGG